MVGVVRDVATWTKISSARCLATLRLYNDRPGRIDVTGSSATLLLGCPELMLWLRAAIAVNVGPRAADALS